MQVFTEQSLLAEWQGWAEQAIVRLEGRHKDSSDQMAVSASLPLVSMNAEGRNPDVRSTSSGTLDVELVRQDLAHEFRLLSGLFLYSSWTTDIHRARDMPREAKKRL